MPVTRALRAAASALAIVAGAGAAAATGAACGDDGGGATAVDAATDAGAGDDVRSPIDAGDAGDGAPVRADFGLDTRPANATCRAPARPPPTSPLEMKREYANVVFPSPPIALAQAPGDRSRWFVALRDGRIVSFPTTSPPNDPVVVADVGALSGMPVLVDGEGGLLGLAFHPKFAQNGRLYVSWNTSGGPGGMRSVVSRLTSKNGGTSFTEHAIVVAPFDQPSNIHKGGGVRFGPDGFLYLSFGDGGEEARAQEASGLFGKILRVDVDNVPAGKTYGVPADNPFAGTPGAEPATFALGLRNPFRFSFDRDTGDLWAGDVGQNDWEEIDVVRAGGNHGWPCREGAHEWSPAACNGARSYVDPVFEYQRTGMGAAVTGGVVYRGSKIAGLAGTYVFGDSFLQKVWTLAFDPTTGAPSRAEVSAQPSFWVDFAEDVDGEIHAVTLDSTMWVLSATAPAPPSSFPDRLTRTGCFDPSDAKRPAPGLVPYDVRSPLWSDGADKERHLAIPDGAKIRVGEDGDFDLPVGAVLAKTFSLGGKRIETRLFVRHDDGEWAGYTYEWNDAQTDALLLPAKKTRRVGAQTWTFPARSECVACHSSAAGRTLGLEIAQLDGDMVYAQTNRIANQLRTLEHIGMLEAPLPAAVAALPRLPRPVPPPGAPATPPEGTLEARARSYLHANCSMCHRPSGPGRGDLDLRFTTALAATKTCNAPPRLGTLGIGGDGGARIVAPGSPPSSVLSARAHTLSAARMPPLASSVVDDAGLAVIDGWIASLAACP